MVDICHVKGQFCWLSGPSKRVESRWCGVCSKGDRSVITWQRGCCNRLQCSQLVDVELYCPREKSVPVRWSLSSKFFDRLLLFVEFFVLMWSVLPRVKRAPCDPGAIPLPLLSLHFPTLYSLSFSIFTFSLSYSLHLFSRFFIPSHSTRIVSLRFQAGCHRRLLQAYLVLSFFVLILCYMYY